MEIALSLEPRGVLSLAPFASSGLRHSTRIHSILAITALFLTPVTRHCYRISPSHMLRCSAVAERFVRPLHLNPHLHLVSL